MLGTALGTKLMVIPNKYPPTKLVQIKSKGDYWFVQVTKPDDVYAITGGNKTARLSTKTKDKRQAELLWRPTETQLDTSWDTLLQRDPFIELLSAHWPKKEALPPKEFIDTVEGGKVLACCRVCMGPEGWNMGLANQLFRYLKHFEAIEFREAITPRANPYPTNIQNEQASQLRQFIEENEGEELNVSTPSPTQFVNVSGCPTILEVLPLYLNSKKRWEGISKKEKKYAHKYIERCVEIIGDKPLDQVIKIDAINIMIALESEGKANSTIGTYKRHLSNLFSWAETHCINDRAQPIQHWLKGNPFFGVGTEGYGAKKRSYEALSEEQLHHLFSLDMPEDHRLLLSILITTGMRLDEVALLEWSQYKKDRNGLRYFDLSLGAIVKNDKFSARTVAIPDCLTLPPASQGRLFNFPVNADGKSSKWASKELNETYFHVIRINKEDDRKVVHSLRHNLTGMMQNLTNPPAPDNHMDWITGHSMEGDKTASERKRTYASDVDVKVKYDIVNRIKHPWLERPNT